MASLLDIARSEESSIIIFVTLRVYDISISLMPWTNTEVRNNSQRQIVSERRKMLKDMILVYGEVMQIIFTERNEGTERRESAGELVLGTLALLCMKGSAGT
jgi:hypothetical protein